MISLFWYIIILVIILSIDIYTDNKQWKTINHTRGFILRVIPVLISTYIYYPHFDLHLFNILCLVGACYWIIFDIGLNLAHGLKWYYLGESALTDSVFKEVLVQYLVKLILLIIFICLVYAK